MCALAIGRQDSIFKDLTIDRSCLSDIYKDTTHFAGLSMLWQKVFVLSALAIADAHPGTHGIRLNKRDSRLEVTLEPSTSGTPTEVIATIKNNGANDLNLLKVGTILDDKLPVQRVVVTDQSGMAASSQTPEWLLTDEQVASFHSGVLSQAYSMMHLDRIISSFSQLESLSPLLSTSPMCTILRSPGAFLSSQMV